MGCYLSEKGWAIEMTDMKRCGRCEEDKPITEFNRHRGTKDGLQFTCKACKKAMSAAYYIKTKEVQIEKGKRYREANAEKVRARTKRYYQENKEKILNRNKNEHTKLYMRTYYLKHKDEIDARVALWRKDNPEKAIEIGRNWRGKYPEKHKEATRNHAKKMRANLSDSYIKQVFNIGKKGGSRLWEIPQALIEVKRLQLLINRRVKNEISNPITR